MRTILILFTALLSLQLGAQDAQWRGPDRNGVFPDTALLEVWPEGGPELLFAVENLGRSYASAVMAENTIFVTGTVDSLEVLFAIDDEGRLLWSTPYGKAWNKSFPEARCTPLVDHGRVYVLSGLDDLACIRAADGEVEWSVDLREEYGSVLDMFGVSESLLLAGDQLICTPSGNKTSVIALDKFSGKTIWQSEPLGTERSNGSPVLLTNDSAGIRQVIAMNRTHVMGVDPENGEICWTYLYNKLNEKGENVTILANSPLVYRDEIFISNGWDQPSVMLKVEADGKSVTEKFTENTLDNQNHGLVRLGDFVYGSNFLNRRYGKWVCMRWSNGEIMWIEDWHTKGPVISADNMLYLLDERKGNLGLAAADSSGLKIVSSFQVDQGKGPFWARPAIYDGKLLVRHGEVLLAYDIRKADEV